MEVIILVAHLLIAIALIATVLLQRSEGGALGMGGGGAGGGLMSGRGAANVLTRATAILAACFMVTSITLAILASSGGETRSIVDDPVPAAEQPADEGAPGTPSAPER